MEGSMKFDVQILPEFSKQNSMVVHYHLVMVSIHPSKNARAKQSPHFTSL